MKKTHKAVLSTLSLLAAIVLSSSVAQAQRCEARAATGGNAVATVRAEGMTEKVGGVELRCVPGPSTSLFATTEVTISVTLNTPITSLTDVDYTANMLDADGTLGAGIDDSVFDPAGDDGPMIDEDEDPNTVVWEELSGASLGLGTGGSGFNLIITGIRANAYMVGDDGEITAQVTVNDGPALGTPELSEVKTGLVVKVDDANVFQCRVGTTGMATISIMEGFATALTDTDDNGDYDMVEVNFSGIPDGVTVMITHTASNLDAGNDPDDMKVTLTGEGDAPTTPETMVEVMLDEDGDGDITYTVSNASDMAQGATLTVSFTWEEDTMIADGMVSVGWESASEGNPQFADAAAVRVIGFDPCETSLQFPFVTNAGDFDTGIAFTNASNYGGTCEIKFYGAEANPADIETQEIPSWGNKTYVLSEIALGFQGFLDVKCDFENGQGFAFISNGYGTTDGPTAAQGYLAIVKD